ncbi:MAG: hypothetical protein JST00_41180 [Deltaproteobacteria bacterium]|nr:hypothetical protein [Deltaproteobacteria bacterium]
MKVTTGDLRDLRGKYERMLHLRRAHERARVDPSFVEPNPRTEMRALAAEFPGALRELDTLPLAEIEERILAITTTVDRHGDDPDLAHVPRWMHAIVLFHRLARGELALRRDGRTEHGERRGRLMDAVYTQLARALGMAEPEVRSLVFGDSGRGGASAAAASRRP